MMSSREEDTEIKLLHHEMLNKLSDEIHPDIGNPWKKFLNMLNVHLTSNELSEATDIFSVCKILERKNKIGYGQYNVLKVLLSASELPKCCGIVESYSKEIEDKRKQISSSLTRNPSVQQGLTASAGCGDITEHKAQTGNQGDKQCHHHLQSEVTFSCIDCDGELICDICTKTLHSGHGFVKISAVADKKKRKMQLVLKNAERKKQTLKESLKFIDTKIKESSENFTRLKNEIILRGERMKADIESITKEFLEKNSTLQEENMKILAEYRQGVKLVSNQLTETINICSKTITSKNEIMIIETDIGDEIEIIFPCISNLKIAHFDAGRAIKDEFGTFGIKVVQELEALRQVATLPVTTVLSSFSHSVTITSVEKSTSEFIWEASNDDKDIILVNQQGKIIDSISLDNAVQDISVSLATGNLWLYLEDSIYEVLDKTPIKRFTTNCIPGCLCITPGENIVVGTALELAVCNAAGRILHTTHNSKEQLVVKPFQITVCSNTGDIAVCDTDNLEYGGDGKPCVSVFNSKLELKFKYFGRTPLSTFLPVDAVYNLQGRLLIAENFTNSVQLVSSTGKFLKVVHSDHLKPTALTMIDDGLLYVCFGETSKIIRY